MCNFGGAATRSYAIYSRAVTEEFALRNGRTLVGEVTQCVRSLAFIYCAGGLCSSSTAQRAGVLQSNFGCHTYVAVSPRYVARQVLRTSERARLAPKVMPLT